MAESQGTDFNSRQLNVEALEMALEAHPIPDTYALDFLFDGTWKRLTPSHETLWTFHKKGMLHAQGLDGEPEQLTWTIDKETKVLTLEKVDESLSFEIEFIRYQLRYISQDWLLICDTDRQKQYQIFYNVSTHDDTPTLDDLKSELETGHHTDQPNYFLILIIFTLILIIIILTLSL